MADKNIFPELNNGALVEAMRAVNKEESRETQSKLIEEAIKASYFAPVDIIGEDGNVLGGNGKMKIPENSKITFKLIQNNNGEHFFALFTDIKEFQKWNKTDRVNTIVVVFPQIAQLVFKTTDVAGFVINPMTENIIFNRQSLKAILEVMDMKMKEMKEAREKKEEKTIEIKFGKADKIPDSVLESLKKTIAKHSEVNSAYFCLMLREETEYYLLALDIDAEPETCEKIANSVSATARLFLTKHPVFAAPFKSVYGNGAAQVTEPFYTK